LGCGTGSFTKHILQRRQLHTKFVALETKSAVFRAANAALGAFIVLPPSAEELRQVLDERGIHRVEAVVSGLPWASLDGAVQARSCSRCLPAWLRVGVSLRSRMFTECCCRGGTRLWRLLRSGTRP